MLRDVAASTSLARAAVLPGAGPGMGQRHRAERTRRRRVATPGEPDRRPVPCGPRLAPERGLGAAPMNVLLVTLDQFRGDCLSAAGHPVVRTPNLDRLAGEACALARHYSQAAPCGPGRACLYTGTYQINNRVVGNGTPLDARFDNVARAARRAGYAPTVFGYCRPGGRPPHRDRARRPPACRPTRGSRRASTWDSTSPTSRTPGAAWLDELGYDLPAGGDAALATEPDRPAEHGVSAFLTDAVIAWLERQDGPWFAHASYWRPHPPYAAAGHWSTRLRPRRGARPVPAPDAAHALLRAAGRAARARRSSAPLRAPAGPVLRHGLRRRRAVRPGPRRAARPSGCGTTRGRRHRPTTASSSAIRAPLGKGGPFESSYHVPAHRARPASSRDPRTRWSTPSRRTSTCCPTICDAIGVEVPAQCDGMPLTAVPARRGAAVVARRGPLGVRLAVGVHPLRSPPLAVGPPARVQAPGGACARTSVAYVQYGDGAVALLRPRRRPDLAHRDHRPGRGRSQHAQAMLTWRSRHADRTLSDMLLVRRAARVASPTRCHDLPELLALPRRSMATGAVGGDRRA